MSYTMRNGYKDGYITQIK